QARKARETLEVIAPLAHRLGMATVKWELEDLSFAILHPKKYEEIVRLVADRAPSRDTYLAKVRAEIVSTLTASKINAVVEGRPKHYWSIYQKMIVKGRDFDDIHDLVGVRILCDEIRDCYAAVGVVHSLWQPMAGRFKDYIAQPRFGVYQSLHTTVVGPEGKPLEVQIRTRDMHRTAEYGIAAHWRYKEGAKSTDETGQKLAWLRSLLEWQNDMRDSRMFMENLKLDLFDTQVFIFSPKGDVFSMPASATPLDFAYQVHTDVGHHCVGAKVNGRIVPLDNHLKNGDIVEVLTNKSARPSLDWLSIVKTSGAKHKIKQWFRKEQKEENTLRGQEAVEAELARAGLRIDVARGDVIGRVAHKLNYQTATDLFAAIGFGDVTASSVVARLREETKSDNVIDIAVAPRPATTRRVARNSSGIRIAGVDDVLVRLSKCCSPVPGDPIMGFVTIGRGVSVHRGDCPNTTYMNAAPERILEAEWLDKSALTHAVDIEIEANDRNGLLQDILGVAAELKTQISSVNARTKRDKGALISMTAQITDLDHLHTLLRKLGNVKDVRNVWRVTKREARASG
ncbi:MAG: bifunctional (p)ppGpp synthetase/guanosine-3',5'-bis(diphosphate) 3'-pyrophosphohydrolase, partial [Acetobacteraceae bacterium]|nr:bifunctional (p)ppGpp synthetase/guanosine-3',5'-bis(diphosphate) 3'-pyrophosphohydrolase [Acetobacteraceae bacterium]